MSNFKVLVSTGGFFNETYRGIRMGELNVAKEVNVSGDIKEEDLLHFASRLAVSTYQERLELEKEGKVLGRMKENISNAFIIDANGLDEYVNGIPGDNFIRGISASIPYEQSQEPSVAVYSQEEMKQMDMFRSK